MNHIQWQMFELDLLPKALFGYHQLSGLGGSYINRIRLEEKNIAIGFVENAHESIFNPPAIIVLGDSGSSEILSWLKVYAPATSPLSQFARVLSATDWDEFQESSARHKFMAPREDRWACIILGEILAQGEGDVGLDALPLSRAAACFSTAMARASIVHGHDYAIHSCIDRLAVLESDRRFVRRSVTIEDLLPIWTIIGVQLAESFDVHDIAELVVEAALKHGAHSDRSSLRFPLLSLKDYPALYSDSIEERTIAFKKLASEVMIHLTDSRLSSYSSALLATGAFLVGRGTTHAFLLRPFAKRIPAVFTWFGLMAAISGPPAWDVNWSRATKGIERLLRAKFNLTDPPVADICWAEYFWLAKTFDGLETFSELPKMLPKVLSIEVVPGAACQFRLLSGQGGSTFEAEQKQSAEIMQRNEELQIALMQFVNLSMKTRQLIDNQRGQSLPAQQSFELGDTKRSSTNNPRSKRIKQDTDF